MVAGLSGREVTASQGTRQRAKRLYGPPGPIWCPFNSRSESNWHHWRNEGGPIIPALTTHLERHRMLDRDDRKEYMLSVHFPGK